jgi:hypothetical protein
MILDKYRAEFGTEKWFGIFVFGLEKIRRLSATTK